MNRVYLAIDLKSFYASVECVERGLDPLNTNLVVADLSRTNKTICLAVSPSLKSFGLSGRPRLYEVEQLVGKLNARRDKGRKSYYFNELQKDPWMAIDYIVATPQMRKYLDYSRRIYEIYLTYVAQEDIHVYSIDEVFIDVTAYLHTYGLTAHELALKMIRDVLSQTGVTATAGIGSNLYLAKVAMDIEAKHMQADKDGVRIAELDEMSYRHHLWDHEPLTDFWRVGRGYAARLAKYGLYTIGDVARFSLKNDGILYDEFGINAELLIDHAWGYEPVTMADIKNYRSDNHSLGSGQVLMRPYTFEEAKIVTKEMIDSLALDMVSKDIVTDHVSLYVGYDSSNSTEGYLTKNNWYGKKEIKPAKGSLQLKDYTSSGEKLMKAILSIYDRNVDPNLLIRRINICADHIVSRSSLEGRVVIEQLDLFSSLEEIEAEEQKEKEADLKEKKIQEAMLLIKKKHGKNKILKGTSYEEAATGRARNAQIGGHRE